MPQPLIQWFTNSGAIADTFGLCVFRAGTSTLASTYTTAALTVTNANPVLFNSAGRPTSGGVFLTPGESYKFELRDFAGVVTPTCIAPVSGSTVWSVDHVPAVPASSVNIDVPGTAAVSFTAGELAYLSDGSASLNAGQWYKADADLFYAGSLPYLGFAIADVSAGSTGSFRLSGQVTDLSGLTPGADYYASTTGGAITLTAPTQARYIGRAVSATAINIQPNPRSTPIKPRAPCGRLTLTSGTPVTTSDVTAATTLYYAPYGGCSSLSVYDGTANWYAIDFSQLSIAVPATTSQMYDAFVYDNAGTATLELTAWTNDTTRATALTTQNGVYVKSGALTRLYLGSFRTTGVSGQTEDSFTKRYVWNYYNRVTRPLFVSINSNHVYTTSTWRQAAANAAYQVDVVVGVAEGPVTLSTSAAVTNTAAAASMAIAIGEDSTSSPHARTEGGSQNVQGASIVYSEVKATLLAMPAAGRHFYAGLQWSDAAGTTSWYYGTALGGQNAGAITGWIEG